ncbi:transcriptional regulator [Actinomadura sp. NBRC 104425]|uniref:helix-turn-helix domain-containing protein n=1 Tax=Actinomadura sp. NBRC 104425 TaxID=3032204 RepID=UPI0024A42109|nr:helix-turn-helix transcriptional regulator [Actinomadura sp. NBRC 104425]GLZ13017.1 transcriptional regulator [Actinomadura sp. NBRC 104425]
MSTSIVLRRRLATELRALRHKAGLSQEAVAEHLSAAVSKIVRIENAQSTVSVGDLRALLALYEVPAQDQEQLIDLARNARKRGGWWSSYRDLLPGKYVALEAEASKIFNYETSFIPGLLQTPDYARALISTDRRLHSEDVPRFVEIRMTRQTRLWAETPSLTLHALIDEAALRRCIGGPAVMRAQLEALCDAMRRPNIEIGVIPLSAEAYPSFGIPFAILRFTDPRDPDVVLVEGCGERYFEEAEDVALFRADWADIKRVATFGEESHKLIEHLIKEIAP